MIHIISFIISWAFVSIGFFFLSMGGGEDLFWVIVGSYFIGLVFGAVLSLILLDILKKTVRLLSKNFPESKFFNTTYFDNLDKPIELCKEGRKICFTSYPIIAQESSSWNTGYSYQTHRSVTYNKSDKREHAINYSSKRHFWIIFAITQIFAGVGVGIFFAIDYLYVGFDLVPEGLGFIERSANLLEIVTLAATVFSGIFFTYKYQAKCCAKDEMLMQAYEDRNLSSSNKGQKVLIVCNDHFRINDFALSW